MNIENLEVGMEVENYVDLCKRLEIEPKPSGKSRRYQIIEIKRFIDFEKVSNGHPLLITHIYDKPLPKVENVRNSKYKLLDTHPDKIKHIFNLLGNNIQDIYCQSNTVVVWRCEVCSRLFQDTMEKVVKNKFVKCISCTLSKDARKLKKILDGEYINYKLEYTFENLKGDGNLPLKFDFAILTYDDNLLGLIEYDGGFHETNEIIKKYDKIKNKYCLDNNIKLLRIHHTDNNQILKLIDFMRDIGCKFYFDYIKQIEANYNQDSSSLMDIDNKIRELRKEKKKIKERLRSDY